MKRILSFTLAEVLIVVGIIGVVATLTLPNLTHSTGDTERVAKVKKVYSNLNLAFEQAQTKYGSLDNWCYQYRGKCHNIIGDRLIEFLKPVKNCKRVSCSIILDENGSGGSGTYNVAVLADGSTISIDHRQGDYDAGIGSVVVDIDGVEKGENASGYDVFKFFFDKDGFFVSNILLEDNSNYVRRGSDHGREFWFLEDSTAWIINFGNMDYLKTSDGTTCPNNTKLTSGGNHTCK